ncbi:MAG: hypothetical protein KF745_07475 [Phycisphaeraceae bacterium]|nr:hypothetical protein [Phycisphaeraceae bacterium]
MNTSQFFKTIATAGVLGAAASLWPVPVAVAEPPAANKAADEKAKDDGSLDRLIFKSGRTAEGKILEEKNGEVKIRVVGPGGLTVETTYNRSEILLIEKGVVKVDAPADAKTDAPAVTGKPVSEGKPGAAKVYLIELKGEFGRDVSATPLRQVMYDARKYQPDVLLVKMDTDFRLHGEEVEDFTEGGAEGAFDQQLETARQLQTIFTDEVRDDPEWKTKPRLVCWVHKALGGAAFLPFVFPEIYFAPDAHHGGIGSLDHLFDGVGDEVVRQKQRSLRLGRAEGLANKGGYNPIILRAMAMSEVVLSVKFEGGKPVFIEAMPEGPDEELLTDDGSEAEGRRDTIQDVARLKGNDNLNLTADLAYKLQVSKGTVDTMDALAFKLGIGRNYEVIDGRSESIITDWGRSVSEAERTFLRKYRDQQELQVQAPGGYDQRTQYRGTRIRLLKECRSIIERYQEALNPRRLRGAPEQIIRVINLTINQLEAAQRSDRR